MATAGGSDGESLGHSRARPRPWAAALLTLVAPGLGQLYAAQPSRAIGTLLLFLVIVPVLMLVFVLGHGALPVSMMLLGCVLAVWFLVVRDAVKCAESGRLLHDSRSKRLLFYLLFVLVTSGCHEAERWLIRTYWFRAFRIPSSGMQPTLLAGDYVMADMRVSRARRPSVGDIVVFETPHREGQMYVKRVLAGPGALVTTSLERPGQLLVDGDPVPGLKSTSRVAASLREDEYFLVGDNFENSLDSRNFGPIPEELILGRVSFVYFSKEPEGVVRWRRLGLRFLDRG